MLAYGVAADAIDEYIKIGGTTALECLRLFCKGIIRLYEQEYLRAPTQEDLQKKFACQLDEGASRDDREY